MRSALKLATMLGVAVVPGAALAGLVAPTATVPAGDVAFRWQGQGGDDGFRFWIKNDGGDVVRTWVDDGKAGCEDGGACAYTYPLREGSYSWEVRAVRGGEDTYLGKARFTVAEGADQPSKPGSDGVPYAWSDRLEGMSFDWSSFRQMAKGSDNWSMTWAGDDKLYATWGDGPGLGTADGYHYVSIGLARFSGNSAASLKGENLIGGYEPEAAKCWRPSSGDAIERSKRSKLCRNEATHAKSQGTLALGGEIYTWLAPGSETTNYKESRLYKAKRGNNNWTRAPWAFERGDKLHLIWPTFLQAGKNHRDVGGYVYVYAARFFADDGRSLEVQRGPKGGEIYLLRAAKWSNLMLESSWEFYAGTSGGNPKWSRGRGRAEPVFTDPRGVGWAMSAHYVEQIDRVVLMTEHDKSKSSRLGVFEAPRPWGPWRTVYYQEHTGPTQPQDSAFHWGFLPNGFGRDGSFTMSYTGVGKLDALNLVDGRFKLAQ